MKRPPTSVSAEYSWPVATPRTTTCAPGRRPPKTSDTEPLTVAAAAGHAARSVVRSATNTRGRIATATTLSSTSRLLPRACAAGADLPDAVSAVVRNQETPIASHGHADGAAPALDLLAPGTVVDDEAGQEVLERTRLAVVHREECHLVARRDRAVPRPVQRHEPAIAIPLRELRARIEGDAE